jgi:hypothetical protein
VGVGASVEHDTVTTRIVGSLKGVNQKTFDVALVIFQFYGTTVLQAEVVEALLHGGCAVNRRFTRSKAVEVRTVDDIEFHKFEKPGFMRLTLWQKYNKNLDYSSLRHKK